MKEKHGCNKFKPGTPGIPAGKQSLFYRAYRAPGLAHFSTLNVLPARGYFRAASGLLLPKAAKEDSWARARESSPASREVRNPVRAAEQPSGKTGRPATRSQYI